MTDRMIRSWKNAINIITTLVMDINLIFRAIIILIIGLVAIAVGSAVIYKSLPVATTPGFDTALINTTNTISAFSLLFNFVALGIFVMIAVFVSGSVLGYASFNNGVRRL